MKRFAFSALLAATTLSVVALAQTTAAPNQPPAPPRPDAPGTPINPEQATPPEIAPAAAPAARAAQLRELVFAEADVDQDSRVSLVEYANFVESRVASGSIHPLNDQTIDRFRQLDQDNDAFLSPSEAAAVQQQPPAQVSPGSPPRAGN